LNSPLNVDFRRPEAFLAVVILSDEDDFSWSGGSLNESYTNTDAFSVASYNEFLASLTSGTAGKEYSVSTISILDETCRSSLFTASGQQKIGQRYIQLADLTGGTKNSLCSPFDQTLDNISNNIIVQAKPVFKLSKTPIVSSIVVVINGVTVPQSNVDGWVYDSVKNTITIYGSTYTPKPKQIVSINFDPDIKK